MKVEAGVALEAGRSHVIKRPRLTRLLDEATARIILLIAPAGYGKTTLAREWLSERPHGWYRGNSATADVAALALGLAKACSTIIPGAGERLKARLRISRAPIDEVERLADLLAEDLTDWPPGAWVGFDDYQYACDSDPAELFVEQLASNCGVRLLVASRSRPKWATARRTLYGEIFEVGRSLLAMSQEEARLVLSDRTIHEAGGLLSMADGWPALIGLATLSRNADMPGETVPEELYSFFAEELYQAAAPDLQQALRRLALAPYVTSDIAETVVGDRAMHVLEEGLELGFFLPNLQDRVELHPLLRFFLASKFRKRYDDPTGELVAQLAYALIALEEWDDVFELASRFADDRVLIKLFEASLAQMLDQARLPTLARWIAAATSRRVDSPLIDLAEAELAFRRGETLRAEAIACQAARRFEVRHPFTSRALWIAGTSAHLTSRDEASLDHFRAASAASSGETDEQQALWGQFLATEALERETDAAALLARFVELSGNTVDERLRCATGHFRMAQLSGNVRRALESNEALIHLVSRSRDPLIRSSFLNSYVGLLVLSGQYEKALAAAETETEFIVDSALDFALPFAQLLTAAANLGLRQFRRCKASLGLFDRSAIKSDFLACNMWALRARLGMATQQLDEGVRILDRAHSIAKTCPPAHAEHLAWCSLAHAVAGKETEAHELANRADSLSHRVEVSALVPWTRAVLVSNRRRSARHAAEAAFETTHETGNIDAFVTAYRAHPRLLELLSAGRANRERLKTVLELARDHALAEQIGLQLQSPRVFDGPAVLSTREREVLDLVAQGLMNKEIGRTLFITEATVKVHLRNICRKLGVRTRTEAAMRAAELSD